MSNPLKDLGLPSEELKDISILLAKKRDIKVYENMSEVELLSALTPSRKAKKAKKGKNPKTSFSKARKKRSEKNLMNQDINFIN